ncbi:Protein of uncharacterised function (DUF2570) [Serratia fonticola]|uniref:DUF2570 domain-containing protein n=1 Tax=Serratia fonticola TaxID=47917 RepID=UPI0021792E9C|nr:DUF2570 domain-containing protein [Serratia fonticola]CAI1071574.1 Protein of uncharacterised function (DUF2570) [Serratia fonticola]
MTSLTKYGLIAAILGGILFSWANSVLTSKLDKANKANEQLVKGVESRDKTITELKKSIDADRRATEEQLKIEQQKRAKADAENRTLREALEHSDCSNQRLPDSAIGILRGEG